jgi:hypothetical protein
VPFAGCASGFGGQGQAWDADLSGVEGGGLVGGDLGALPYPAGAAVEVEGVDPVEFAGDDVPGGAGGGSPRRRSGPGRGSTG